MAEVRRLAHVKLFRSRYGRILIVAALLLAGILGLRLLLRPAIFQAHTGSLLQQLDMAYRDSVTSGQRPATTSNEFIDRIPQWIIDWNSCRFHHRTIYDSWGTPAEIRFFSSQIELRSAGPDRQADTSDDIVRQTPNPTGA